MSASLSHVSRRLLAQQEALRLAQARQAQAEQAQADNEAGEVEDEASSWREALAQVNDDGKALNGLATVLDKCTRDGIVELLSLVPAELHRAELGKLSRVTKSAGRRWLWRELREGKAGRWVLRAVGLFLGLSPAALVKGLRR